MHPFIVAFVLFIALCGAWALRVAHRTATQPDDTSTIERYSPYDASRAGELRRAHSRRMFVFGSLLLLLAIVSLVLSPHHKVIMSLAVALVALSQLWDLVLRRRFTKPGRE